MKLPCVTLAAVLCALPKLALAEVPVKHIPVGSGAAIPAGVQAGVTTAPFSAAVQAGDTLYLSGTTDSDPLTGKLPPDAATGAKAVLDHLKHTVEAAGYTMDDLVWVQVFAQDLKTYADFNTVYRTYFKGPLPARAFIGAGSLLGGAHFEVMGIAVKRGK